MQKIKPVTCRQSKTAVLMLLISALLSTAACSPKNSPEPEEPNKGIPVNVETVSKTSISDEFSLPAYAEAWETVELRSQAAGDILSLNVSEGEWIDEGGLLIRLDNVEAAASFEYSQKALENAETNFKRMQSLYESGFVSLQAFDEAEGVYRSALASFTQGQSNLDKTILRAPISGYVDRIFIEEGESLSFGQTVLRIVNTSRMRAVVGLPEKDVRFFSAGDPVRIEIATFGEPQFFDGEILSISYTADEMTRSYRCAVEISDPVDIRPGMVLKVLFTRKTYQDVLTAPLYSLILDGDEYILFTVENDQAIEINPKTGPILGESVIIESGLEEGDLLVVRGHQYLSNGISVNTGE